MSSYAIECRFNRKHNPRSDIFALPISVSIFCLRVRAKATTQTKPEEAPRQTVRVVIADDHSTVRKTVRSILEQHPGFEVCGEATDGSSIIVEAERLKPDAVVLNINMPVLDGLEAAREIKQKLAKSAIVIVVPCGLGIH